MSSSGLGGGVTFRRAIEDAVASGHAGSVDAYLAELRAGRNAAGRVPYGGAVEVDAFVHMHPEFEVRVWAAPGDALAAVAPGMYVLRSVHSAGDGRRVPTVVDLRVTATAHGGHYEFIEVCAAGHAASGGDAPDPELLSGSDSADEPEPPLCDSGSGPTCGGAGCCGRRASKARGRVHHGGVPAATHEDGPQHGRYEQGGGPPFARRHSPAHAGFDRNNARLEGFAWVRRVMHDDMWLEPPEAPLMDYVPTGARPFYVEQWREMVDWLNRYPGDEERWFLLLRAWPVLVTGPLRRGGDCGAAADQLIKRLELWRDFRFEELYDRYVAECGVRARRRGGDGARSPSAGSMSLSHSVLKPEEYGGQLHGISLGNVFRWRMTIVTLTSIIGAPRDSARFGAILSQF